MSLFLVPLLIFGCGGPTGPDDVERWWTADRPCPQGATLVESVPPPIDLQITAPVLVLAPEERQAYLARYRVRCQNGPDARKNGHGRFTEWYGNGQRNSDGEYEDGRLVRLTQWDQHGHRLVETTCGKRGKPETCHTVRTQWHDDGYKWFEGPIRGRKAHGVWREWNAAGEVVGELEYRMGGQAGPMRVSTSKRLLFVEAWGSDLAISPSDDLQHPIATSLVLPQIAINLVASRRDVVVDGQWTLKLEPIETLATRSDKLRERLDAQLGTTKELAAESGAAWDERLMVQLHRELPLTVVSTLMQTAYQAGFRQFDIVVQDDMRASPGVPGMEMVQLSVVPIRWDPNPTGAVLEVHGDDATSGDELAEQRKSLRAKYSGGITLVPDADVSLQTLVAISAGLRLDLDAVAAQTQPDAFQQVRWALP